jgi:hypothetical protein
MKIRVAWGLALLLAVLLLGGMWSYLRQTYAVQVFVFHPGDWATVFSPDPANRIHQVHLGRVVLLWRRLPEPPEWPVGGF